MKGPSLQGIGTPFEQVQNAPISMLKLWMQKKKRQQKKNRLIEMRRTGCTDLIILD